MQEQRFIEWSGNGECPVVKGTKVDVKFRDWDEDSALSQLYHWWHDGENCDIIAYRITKPSATLQEAIAERLITVTQEVKYTVVIRGITFTFTQDELDALAEELLGFTTL